MDTTETTPEGKVYKMVVNNLVSAIKRKETDAFAASEFIGLSFCISKEHAIKDLLEASKL